MNSKAFLEDITDKPDSHTTFFVSVIDSFREYIHHQIISFRKKSTISDDILSISNPSLEKSFLSGWRSTGQIFIQLLIWILLGFATGFFVGLIQPR